MPLVQLNRDMHAVVSACDLVLLRSKVWRVHFSNSNGKPYARSSDDVYMHRLITACPATLKVDHKNGNTLDNRRSNLRVVNFEQNNANRKSYSASGFKGVRAVGHRWRARIAFRGVETHIGYFGSAEDAARAYDDKALETFGPFAWLNFPPPEEPDEDDPADLPF